MPEIFSKEKICKILKKRYPDLPADWAENDRYFPRKPLSVFSYDVDSIKNYVFSSSEFKAIIGASKLVSDFDVIANNFLENENSYVIHAVGGTGLAIVLSEELHRIEQELIKAFEENVPGGFLTTSSVDFYPSELIYGLKKEELEEEKLEQQFGIKFNNLTKEPSFYRLFSLLASKMREKKNSKQIEMKRITPEFHICESCNTYPAFYTLPVAADINEPGEIRICEACKKKIEVGEEKIKKDHFASSLLKIDTKADEEQLSDWLGVIYIDGNNLGKLYSRIQTDQEYIKVSENIERASINAVNQVIEQMKLKDKYASPILGGDDIMLFVPSRLAIDIYFKLDEILTKEFRNIDGKGNGISYCGSILFCKKTMPLKIIFEASNSLLKEAKSAYYNNFQKGEKEKNYIATRVLWGNSTEVKTTEYFGTNKEIKEIIGEAMEFEEFKRYYNLLKRLSNEEVTFLQKAAKLMNEIAPVAKLNVNYFFTKNIKNLSNYEELYNSVFFPEEGRTKVLSSIDLLKFIDKGAKQ